MTFETNVIYKITQEKKGNNLEMGNVYFTNVPVTYAQVHKAGKKYQSEDTAYQMNIFITEETHDKVEELGINKVFAEVGKTKLKKGTNRGKFKYPAEDDLAEMKGMFGAQLTRNTVKRDTSGTVVKEYAPLKVIDTEGELFSEDLGNGSVCTVKCFAYRNSEDMLNLMMDTVQVVDHISYEGGSSDTYDDVMGVNIPQVEAAESESDTTAQSAPVQPQKSVSPPSSDDFDDDFDIF